MTRHKKISIPLILGFIFLCVFAVIELYPFIWMIISGCKANEEMLLSAFSLPSVWHWENYAKAWNSGISKYFVNSVITTLVSTVLIVFLSAFAAYPLARMKFKGRHAVLMFILGGLMLSPMVSLIPLYKMFSATGIYNTYAAMIIPYVAFQIPFTVFLIWSNFITLPHDIEESAEIEGCGTMRILVQLIMPISIPMIITAAVLAGRYVWNEMLFALCFIEDSALKTIPVGLLGLRSQTATDWSVLVAGLALSTIPVVIAFIFSQKYLMRGMTAGSVKM